MELALWCVVVFTLTGLVTSTPHGYGVKGGAATKAEANAAAGAFSGFGGLPGAIPAGPGYSGSFSKSSSSSFASSSASSSASSFSFTGSGAAAPNGGCSTGLCQNGNTGQHGSNDNLNSYQLNNGANAGAAAGSQAVAIAGSYPQCTGNNCGNQNDLACQGPTCKKLPIAGNNCEAGQCQSKPSTQPSSYDDETNSSSSSSDAESHTFDFGQKGDFNSGDNLKGNSNCKSGTCGTPSLNCASGQCGPSANGNRPLGYGHSGTNLSNKQQEKDHVSNNKPEKCATGECQSQPPNSYYDNNDIPVNIAGSSFKYNTENKPLNNDKLSGSINSPSNCADGKCGSSQHSGSKPPCTSPDCYKNSINNPHAAAAGSAVAPAYNKPATQLTAPKHEPSCTSAACQSAGSSGQYLSSYITPQGSYPGASCSGENCSPSYNPSNTNSIASRPNRPSTDYEIPPSKCSSANCATNPEIPPNHVLSHNYPSSQTLVPGGGFANNPIPSQAFSPPETLPAAQPIPGAYRPVYSINKPDTPSSISNYKPISTQGIAPGYPVNPSTLPNHQFPSNEDSIPPHVPLGPSSSSNCASTGLCTPSPTRPAGPGYSSYPSLVPNNQIPTYQGSMPPNGPLSPSSSPNCDGIRGCVPSQTRPTAPSYSSYPSLVPNNQIPSNQGSIPSYGHLNPSSSPNCAGTGACAQSPINPNYASHPIGHAQTPLSPAVSYPSSYPKPSTGTVPTIPINPGSHEKPYTGGFGGPSGLLKPLEHNIPSITPAISGSQYTSPCHNGNCHSQPNQPATHQQANTGQSSGSHNLAPCALGNCGGSPILQTGGAGAVASANAVAYAGGFGGPPGILKPFDDGKVGKSQSGFGDKYSSNPQFGSGHGGNSPNGDTYHNAVGSNGQAGAGAQAVAIAGANAGSYGGNNYQHGGNQHNSGANSGHNTLGGCGGGCPSNGAGGSSKLGLPDSLSGGLGVAGAAAKAGAGSGSFGYGGNFASSSASAHASSGAGVKGGYGRR